jgi:hypothetical protein
MPRHPSAALIVTCALASSSAGCLFPSSEQRYQESITAAAEITRAARAPEFAKSRVDLEQEVSLATKGFEAVRPVIHGDLTNPVTPMVHRADACLLAVIRLDEGASFSDRTKTWGLAVVFFEARQPRAGGELEAVGPGAIANVGCRLRAWSDPTLMLGVHDSYDPSDLKLEPIGSGGYTLQIFKRDMTRGEISQVRREECTTEFDLCRQGRLVPPRTLGQCLELRDACVSSLPRQ